MSQDTISQESRPSVAQLDADPAAAEQELIQHRLGQTRRNVKLVDLATGFATMAAGILAYLLVLALIDHWVYGLTPLLRLLALVALLGGVAAYFVWRILPPLVLPVNPVYAAHSIEQAAPSLKNSLINLLLLRQGAEGVRAVVYAGLRRQAAGQLANLPPEAMVDHSSLIRVGYCLVGLMAVAALYKVLSPKDPLQSVARVVAPWEEIAAPARVKISEVLPGTVDVFRGETIDVQARIEGLREDEPARLLFSSDDGQFVDQPLVMEPLGGQQFHALLASGGQGLQQSVSYRLTAGDSETNLYRVTVKDAPYIAVSEVVYQYPSYTGLESRTVLGQGDLIAVEGTRVRIKAEANLPIGNAYLEFFPSAGKSADGPVSQPSQLLTMQFEGQKAWAQYTLLLQPDRHTPQAGAYQVRFTTREAGQRNASPARYPIQVTPDLTPEVEILQPLSRDVELAENESLTVEVRALDPDFAVRRIRLKGVSGGVSRFDALLLDDAQPGQVIRKYPIVPNKMGLKAGDSVVFWAQVEDTRHAATGRPEPNLARTANYRVTVLAPNPQAAGGDQEASGGDDSADATQPQPGSDGQDSTQPQPDKGQPGQQGTGPQGEGQQGTGPQGEGQQGTGQQGEGPQGEGPQGEGPQGEGQQGEGQQGEGQQGEGPQGEGPPGADRQGEGQAGRSAAEPRGERPAGLGGQTTGNDDSTGASQAATEGADPAAGGGEQAGADSGAQAGRESERAAQESDGPSGSDPANSNAGSPENGVGDEGDASEREPVPSDGSNDSDAFERILRHLREQGGDAQGAGADEPSTDTPPPDAPPPDAPPTGQPRQQGPAGAESPDPAAAGRATPDQAEGNRGSQGDAERRGAGADSKAAPPGEGAAGQAESPEGSDSSSPRNGSNRPSNATEGQDASKGTTAPGQRPPAGSEPDSDASDPQGSREPAAAGGDSNAPGERVPGNRPGDLDARAEPAGTESDGTQGAGSADGQDAQGQPTTKTGGGGRPGAEEGQGEPSPSGSGASQPGGDMPNDAGAGEPPIPDEANLEYAQKATDLALDYLRHKPADPELLDRLGWTAEELKAFQDRWESMRRQTQQAGAPGQQARQQLADQLQGLGLRPDRGQIRRSRAGKEARQVLRQSGADGAIPPEYREQYRAFLKSVAPTEE